ncbi:MAG: rRNA pseudouridine synthase, partial [Bacteroidetes bacterium]|nr:rRNA pseudouridine synthase [Bacteroidota bacterium]
PLDDTDKKEFLKGVFLERRSKFVKVTFANPKNRKVVEVESVEGRNHFVKRMFQALGQNVKSLNRKSFAGIKADIPLGTYREMNKTEVQKLFNKYS